MASMSVKNRVAMFEHAGNKSDEDVTPLSPTGRSFKRPSTPSSQTFKKATTPTGKAVKAPVTPTGPSYLRPTTPNTKTFDRTNVSASSPRDKKTSWPWPAEESVIPAPSKEALVTAEDSRRYSSPFNAPVILPQKSPKPKPSVNSTPFILPQKSPNGKPKVDSSPLKHIHNQDNNGASTPRKTANSPVQALQRKFESGTKKSFEPTTSKPFVLPQYRTQSSVATAPSKNPSMDENKAPIGSEPTNPRNKALKLAKSRNSLSANRAKASWSSDSGGTSKDKHNSDENHDRNTDESSTSSSQSSNTNNELSNIANKVSSRSNSDPDATSATTRFQDGLKEEARKSVDTKISTFDAPVPTEKQIGRLSRAGKLSQTQRRVNTPESTSELSHEASIADSKTSLEPPMPVVRGARTVSKVSHQEARQALLQAAQKKKEKADAARQLQLQVQQQIQQQIQMRMQQQTQYQQYQQQLIPTKVDNKKAHDESPSKNAADRLALKAANVLAIKNSSKPLFGENNNVKFDGNYDTLENHKDHEVSTNASLVSGCSDQKRRKNHPAFAARSASPRPSWQQGDLSVDSHNDKSSAIPGGSVKPFSEELFSSFRYFQETLPEVAHQPISLPDHTTTLVKPVEEEAKTVTGGQQNADLSKPSKGRPPHPQMASPMWKSPKTIKEAMSAGSGSVLQGFESSQTPPMHADSNTGRLSIDSNDSPFMEQEESLHSTSERNFDRRYMDGFYATGHPKYAPPRQAFPQQEGGYMSSLSSNTFSTQSMLSAANEQPQFMLRIGTETLHPLGEMSPGPSMRSGHSLAHSIISMSPRVETSRHGSAFEYLNSPSRHSNYDFDPIEKTTPAGVPPQIDEEEGSEPTFEYSIEAPSEPTVGSSIEARFAKLNEFAHDDEDSIFPIQTSYSAADAPPGFVFHDDDTEGSGGTIEKPKIPDPVGMSFDDRQQYVYDEVDEDKSAQPELFFEPFIEEAFGPDPSMDCDDPEQGGKIETMVKFSDQNEVYDVARRPSDPSSSTKGTVSTSLRSGLSSIQNGASGCANAKDHVGESVNICSPREGSKSIRSGLSGLQNPSDLEGSASMRSVSVSMKSTTVFNDLGETGPVFGSQFPLDPPPQLDPPPPPSQGQSKRPNLPATIEEVDDEETSGIKSKVEESPSVQHSQPQPSEQQFQYLEHAQPQPQPQQRPQPQPLPQPPPQRVETRVDHSVLGTQSTATTDVSSGESGNKARDEADSDRMKHILPAALTPINTQPERIGEDMSIQSASSRHSRWKMKMPNMIKSVLAKASPRSGMTPRGELNERTGFSTSDEEEDDIFGGLEAEDDLAKVMGDPPKKPSSTKSANGRITAKRSNRQPPTPNKFFSSGHTRKSEPPRIVEKEVTPRRSVRSESRSTPIARKKTPENKLSFKGLAKRLASPMAGSTPVAHDRSGTVVEQEMEHVNSDITSSILGAPFQKFGLRPRTPKKGMQNEIEDEKALAKTPKAKTSKPIPSSTKSTNVKTPTADCHSVAAESKKSRNSQGKDTLLDGTIFDDETKMTRATSAPLEESTSKPVEETKEEPATCMFMNLGCGISDAFSAVASVCNFGAKDDEEPEVKTVVNDEDEGGTYISADSNNTSSHLTELEKRVWNEWDKLDSAFTKQAKTVVPEKKEEHDKKREVARGKLLEIANSAISSQVTKEGEQSAASVSYTTGSSSDSADTGESSGMTGSSSEGPTSSAESRSYLSGSDNETDLHSASVAPKPTTTPILLSFSQRSLIEKFSKQLANVGVEVLKMNRRKQWQVRYFTVSKEQIALIAHEADSKSGAEVAQCPKALLWLKKFNAKGGGYSLANIDKSGHGGMLLVDLKDIHVSIKQDLENPFPKKIAEKFKDSVLVALEYQFNNEKRRIEFRCKDNDEAQFLCTCMRVIRDLLKREQALRLKTQDAKSSTKKK